MYNKYTVQLFIWSIKGLDVIERKFDDVRDAMDFAYSISSEVLKVFDKNNSLIHDNIHYECPSYN